MCSLLIFGTSQAQTPNLIYETTMPPFKTAEGIFLPQGSFNGKTLWLGPSPNATHALWYDNRNYNNWMIGEFKDTNSLYDVLYMSLGLADVGEIPVGSGSYHTVSIAAPSLSYSSSTFAESMDDDGSISGKITINHNKWDNKTFGGTDGDDFIQKGYAQIDNLPGVLEASIIRTSDSTLEFFFRNKASYHDDDTSFILTFTDDAYGNGGKADSTYYNTQKIEIEFIKTISVAKNGGDYDSIQTALNKADEHDVIKIAEGTYTESIVVPETLTNIVIIGEGPGRTIIQADTIPFIANSGVLNLHPVYNKKTSAYVEGVTIQNGFHSVSKFGRNNSGAGIKAWTLVMKNCRVLNNAVSTSDNSQIMGGGIFAESLEIYDCEISGNRVEGPSQTSIPPVAGGIFAAYLMAKNCTISGNYSSGDGGGLYKSSIRNPGLSSIANTTIYNNESDTKGGGLVVIYELESINSIIYGNKSGENSDIYQYNSKYPMYVWNSIIGDVKGYPETNIIGTSISADPKLDTLAFNCSYTRTHALLDGSPAIDAGLDSTMVPTYDQRGFKAYNTKDIGSHESVNEIFMDIPVDSICLGSSEEIVLEGSHRDGKFFGTGVSNTSFSAANINEEGYVIISYVLSSNRCALEIDDSIYVYKCVNNVRKHQTLDVSIYPNPANDRLWIKTENAQNASIRIIDIAGNTVLETLLNKEQEGINIKDLPKGIYVVSTSIGGLHNIQKFVKL